MELIQRLCFGLSLSSHTLPLIPSWTLSWPSRRENVYLVSSSCTTVCTNLTFHHLPKVFISGLLSFVLARDRTSPASANVVKGDFFVGLGLLQNASTPFLTLAYLFRKAHIELGERIATLCTVVVYFLCRISLWPYMLHVYSEREKGGGMIGAFFRIPAQCQIGWSLLLGTNVCLFLFANFAC